MQLQGLLGLHALAVDLFPVRIFAHARADERLQSANRQAVDEQRRAGQHLRVDGKQAVERHLRDFLIAACLRFLAAGAVQGHVGAQAFRARNQAALFQLGRIALVLRHAGRHFGPHGHHPLGQQQLEIALRHQGGQLFFRFRVLGLCGQGPAGSEALDGIEAPARVDGPHAQQTERGQIRHHFAVQGIGNLWRGQAGNRRQHRFDAAHHAGQAARIDTQIGRQAAAKRRQVHGRAIDIRQGFRLQCFGAHVERGALHGARSLGRLLQRFVKCQRFRQGGHGRAQRARQQ